MKKIILTAKTMLFSSLLSIGVKAQTCDNFSGHPSFRYDSYNLQNYVVGDTIVNTLSNNVPLVMAPWHDGNMTSSWIQNNSTYGPGVLVQYAGAKFLFDGNNKSVTYLLEASGHQYVSINGSAADTLISINFAIHGGITLVNGVTINYSFLGGSKVQVIFTGNISDITIYGDQLLIKEVCTSPITPVVQACDNFSNYPSFRYDSYNLQNYVVGGTIINVLNYNIPLVMAPWHDGNTASSWIQNNSTYGPGVFVQYAGAKFLFDGSNKSVTCLLEASGHQYVSINGSAADTLINVNFAIHGGVTLVNGVTINYSFLGGSKVQVTFTGNISDITIYGDQLLIKEICSSLIPCQIDANYTYSGTGYDYAFQSSGTGTEHLWDFGDGTTSTLKNPLHHFPSSGNYIVRYTNYNLTNNCTKTINDTIRVNYTTPNGNIITPNQDGQDDFLPIQCNNVKVYDRNGVLVTTLTNQTSWGGTDSSGSLVPMGEYVLICETTQISITVTVIW